MVKVYGLPSHVGRPLRVKCVLWNWFTFARSKAGATPLAIDEAASVVVGECRRSVRAPDEHEDVSDRDWFSNLANMIEATTHYSSPAEHDVCAPLIAELTESIRLLADST